MGIVLSVLALVALLATGQFLLAGLLLVAEVTLAALAS